MNVTLPSMTNTQDTEPGALLTEADLDAANASRALAPHVVPTRRTLRYLLARPFLIAWLRAHLFSLRWHLAVTEDDIRHYEAEDDPDGFFAAYVSEMHRQAQALRCRIAMAEYALQEV